MFHSKNLLACQPHLNPMSNCLGLLRLPILRTNSASLQRTATQQNILFNKPTSKLTDMTPSICVIHKILTAEWTRCIPGRGGTSAVKSRQGALNAVRGLRKIEGPSQPKD